MDREDILKTFKDCGAFLQGHFLLSSGLHSADYLQCALYLAHPSRAACAGCPAFNYQETGQENLPPEYVCETTRRRWSTMQGTQATGNSPGS